MTGFHSQGRGALNKVRSAARLALIFVTVAISAVCAMAEPKVLRAEDKQRLTDIDLELLVPQESFALVASSPDLAKSTMGGLVPVLIDLTIQMVRQEGLKVDQRAFLDSLLEVDLREDARSELESQLSSMPLKFRSLAVTAVVPTSADLDKKIAATKGSHPYMQLALYFSFDDELKVITTLATARLWQDGNARRSYEAVLVYQGMLRDDAGRRIEGMGRPGAKALQLRFREAIRETARMLAADVQHPDGPVAGQMGIRRFATGMDGLKVKGEIIEGKGPRPLLRDQKSVIFSLE